MPAPAMRNHVAATIYARTRRIFRLLPYGLAKLEMKFRPNCRPLWVTKVKSVAAGRYRG